MGIKPIPIKNTKKILKSLNLQYVRTKSSHEIWDRPDNPLPRPVTIDTNYKDVPILHLHTTLKAIGISKKKFEEILKSI